MKIKSFFLLLITATLLFSCSKELSDENSLGNGNTNTAVYSFYDGTGNCISVVTDGNYVIGTALTASNTVTLSVDVATVGTWSLSTPILNGIGFSGSGNFTSTGLQTVTLTGSGTPTSEGVFSYKPGSNGCTYTITVSGTSAASDSLYYDISVNGVQYKKASSATSDYGFETSVDGTDSAVLNSGISWYASPEPPGATYFYLSKGFLNNYPSASAAAFKAFLGPGAYTYSVPGSFNGITIEWKDANDKVWKSNNAPGTQTGSSFQIIRTDEFTMVGVNFVRIYAEFNCKLYDNSGAAITITNGKYLGAFQQE